MTQDDTAEFEIPPALAMQLATLAAAMDRSLSWLIEQAVADFVALQSYRLAATDPAEAEPLPPGEDVIAWVRAWDPPEGRRMRRAA